MAADPELPSTTQEPEKTVETRSRQSTEQSIGYATADAFHDSVKARLRSAAERSRHSVNELRRQFAYDRLLTRVFIEDPGEWVLKGATALLARIPDQARHSMDIDLYYRGETTKAAEALATASDLDLGDHFTFDIYENRRLAGDNGGVQSKATAYIGNIAFMDFQIDTVIATNMTGTPEPTACLSPITIDGLTTTTYRAYPVVDHIADKHAAMLATYKGQPSTRYRDLVDLVLIATSQQLHASQLHRALMSEYAHRGLTAPRTVTLPSPEWRSGFTREAQSASGFTYLRVDQGLDIARRLLDPILGGRTTGQWNPGSLEWIEG